MTTGPSGRFAGKVGFVTGGASGIGRATALAFAREGAHVVVADLSEQGGHETARVIEDLGGRALTIRCDVTRSEDVKAALDQAVDAFRSPRRRLQQRRRRTGDEGGGRHHRAGVGPDHRHQPPGACSCA